MRLLLLKIKYQIFHKDTKLWHSQIILKLSNILKEIILYFQTFCPIIKTCLWMIKPTEGKYNFIILLN